jgi:hypothetical protein
MLTRPPIPATVNHCFLLNRLTPLEDGERQ